MDIIVLGVYSDSEKDKLNKIVSSLDNLEIVWDYGKYNIESCKGVELLKKVFKLSQTGVLVERDREATFSSYPLIYEISDTFISGDTTSKLFQFFDKLENTEIRKMIIAFADEWDENTLVKIEKCDFYSLKKRLNTFYVWCESYVNLISDTEMRGDEHPLILEIENNTASADL